MKPTALLLLFVLLLPASALGQSYQLPSDPGFVGIQFLKPSFADIVDDASSYTVYVTARHDITPSINGEIGIPFTHLGLSGESENTIGNLFLGVEARNEDAHTAFEVGVWAPTAPDDKADALLVAIGSDLNRWESFLPDTFSALLAASYEYVSPEYVGFRMRVGPTVWIPTEDEGRDTESFLLYSGHVGYFGEMAEVTGGVMGRFIMTEDGGGFGDRSSHQVELEAALKAQAARFGLVLVVPIDDNELVDFVYGFQVGAAIPGPR
jgi:hypothetical protein